MKTPRNIIARMLPELGSVNSTVSKVILNFRYFHVISLLVRWIVCLVWPKILKIFFSDLPTLCRAAVKEVVLVSSVC